MTISIVIPVLNTKTYLPTCLDSILSQSFTDFEVLLVDDGSTDGSGIICDEYARRDKRVRVFHQENGGVSSARNLGLENANGEWVYFVDSDDEVFPGGLQIMVDGISDDVDIVMGGYEKYYSDGSLFYKIDDREVTVLDKSASLISLFERHGLYYDTLPYLWNRLFRNRIIQEHHLRFDTGLRNKEDTLFITKYICRSNGITRFNTAPVYKYTLRGDGLMGSARFGFDYPYVDSLYALIQMEREILQSFPPSSETVFIAKEGIWVRYWKILAKMNKAGVEDEELRSRLRTDVYKEVGKGFFTRKRIRKIRLRIARLFQKVLPVTVFALTSVAFSCAKDNSFFPQPEMVFEPDTSVVMISNRDLEGKNDRVDLNGIVTISEFAPLDNKHQSAAVYGDYAFFVTECRKLFCLYDMTRKAPVYKLVQKGEDDKIYHCNQSTFGIQKYYPEDSFPLLYISQRAPSDNRCLTEVFRIIPFYSADSTALVGFHVEMVQKIFFPAMTQENSMGNVNSVIDPDSGWMYTYSRNKNVSDSNYLQCKISKFAVPDIYEPVVFLEDSDIQSSFMIDAKALNMQGGCIANGLLYIGQGYPLAGYVYLNVIDLASEKLVKQYDLLGQGVDWEPQGCFYYDGNVMLSHTGAICSIVEKD